MASPVVAISEGQVRGCVGTDIDGGQFHSFLGIPYAKPPVGELRFKAPQPVEPWSGIKETVKVGDACIQRDMLFTGAIIGSEDCLHLNVFTRTLPQEDSTLKPVMVWIHGGGLIQGSNDIKTSGPEYIMTEDVVLVTINYRLGYLGFLRLKDPSLEVPGNAGLKDQVLALKWVQRNIKQFNGDPNNVTIFGESAGGACVHSHILSPASKGLFHKAIPQSGSVLNPWALTNHNTFEFFDFMEKGIKDEKTALEVLRNMPVNELFDYQDRFLLVQPPLGVIGLVIEEPNPTAFLTKDPMEVIISGEYNKVPMIWGYTSNEGMLFVPLQEMSKKGKAFKVDEQLNLEDFVPPNMKLERGCSTSQEICKKIADFYFKGENAMNKLLLISDYYFVIGILASIINHARTCHYPIFLYRMSCETNLNASRVLFKLQDIPGVCHGDDVGYLFKNSFFPDVEIGEIEMVCLRRFLKLWTNFAKYGNPTPEKNDLNIQWKPVDGEHVNILDIGKELVMETNPEDESVRLWKDIYQMSPATANYL
uniref:Putative alpha-esterase n=1 Tax=Leptinotarsa decemlineata TaxID=7539 RepID=A0A0A7EP48_LEPDE|nr:putative alpha-esterase [Leptinotarsa decemlineata]